MILGIDPGTLNCGYGLVLDKKGHACFVAAGTIERKANQKYSQRLFEIVNEIEKIIIQHQVSCLVLEEAFTHKNVQSAFRLAEIRGALFFLAGKHGLKLFEYAPKKIKKSLTGNGNATKEQVALLVAAELKVELSQWRHDASDALAIALHHFHNQRTQQLFANISL